MGLMRVFERLKVERAKGEWEMRELIRAERVSRERGKEVWVAVILKVE